MFIEPLGSLRQADLIEAFGQGKDHLVALFKAGVEVEQDDQIAGRFPVRIGEVMAPGLTEQPLRGFPPFGGGLGAGWGRQERRQRHRQQQGGQAERCAPPRGVFTRCSRESGRPAMGPESGGGGVVVARIHHHGPIAAAGPGFFRSFCAAPQARDLPVRAACGSLRSFFPLRRGVRSGRGPVQWPARRAGCGA